MCFIMGVVGSEAGGKEGKQRGVGEGKIKR